MTYLVPNDTKEILNNYTNNTDRNLNLEFNKFIGEWKINNDGILEVGNRKYEAFERITRINHATGNTALKNSINRIKTTLKAFEKSGCKVKIIDKLNSQWRLAVGVGSNGPLETGITLHHLCGYPYIPATSVKGIARAGAYLLDEELSMLRLQVFNNYVENLETKEFLLKGEFDKLKVALSFKDVDKRHVEPTKEELKIIKDNFCKLENIRGIFGSQSSVGLVTFLDGLPDGFPKLEVDVLAPHYGEYYSAKEKPPPPGDWMQPVPSFFLTVAAGKKYIFSFFVSNSTDRYKNFNYSGEIVAIMAEKWLTEGLKQLGIGGKTSSGYGYFENPDEKVQINRPIQNILEELKKDEAIAEIVSIDKKPYRVKIEGYEGTFNCSGFNPAGLGLKPGSRIIVSLTIDKKSKKIVSCKYINTI
jgi:CRISPR-associated protein Cmr6